MHESERNRLRNEIRRLALAEADMRQMAAAAKALQTAEGGDLSRALETAIVVCYARPFTSNEIGPLEREWVPTEPELRALHEQLITLRHKAYAHTDRDFRKLILQKDADGRTIVGEGWYGILRERLPLLIQLAVAQGRRFQGEVANVRRNSTVCSRAASRTALALLQRDLAGTGGFGRSRLARRGEH